MTAETFKALMQDPILCFFVMLLGTLTSIGKQLIDARRTNEARVTFMTYLMHFWPETMVMVMTNTAAFIGLVTSDMLNAPAAWGIGYAANSIADLIRSAPTSRSGSLANRGSDTGGEK